MRIDKIIKERRASLLEIPPNKLTFEKRLLLSAHEPTKKKYMTRYGVDDSFIKRSVLISNLLYAFELATKIAHEAGITQDEAIEIVVQNIPNKDSH